MPGQSEFRCRGCDGNEASVLLDMGTVPLANAFVSSTRPDADRFRSPLTLVMCVACRVVQIREVLPPEVVFADSPWVAGTSAAARRLAADFADSLALQFPAGGFVIEIMSNDGGTLAACRSVGFTVLGVDPSDVAAEADANGIPSVRAFFDPNVARRIRADHGAADVVVARHAFGHAAEPADLVRGAIELLRPCGRLIIEVPYALLLRDELQYDTVFHEHVTYWTVGSLAAFLGRFGFRIGGLTFVPLNGGSLRAEAVLGEGPEAPATTSVSDLEAVLALNHPRGWTAFAERVDDQRHRLVELLRGLSTGGANVVAYGAAAKFMTMLNFCGIGPDLVRAVGDANPRKQGTFCPGVRIPVVSPEALVASRPDYILIGAWNYRDEIVSHLRERLHYANRFILPLPLPRVF